MQETDGREVASVDPPTPRPAWPDDLAEALGEIGDDAQVAIYRVASGKREYIDTLEADAFSLDAVRDAWGPGRYQARLKAPDGTWRKSGTFSIADLPPAARRPSSDDPPAWVGELLAEMRATGRGGAAVPGEGGALQLFAEVSALAQAQTASMMAMIEKLTPRARGGGGMSPGALADLVLRSMEMGIESAQGGGGGGASTILANQVPRLLSLIERAAGQPGGAPAAMLDDPMAAAEAAAGNGGEAMPIPVPAVDSPFADLAPWLPRLLRLADSNADVSLWATTIGARFPEMVDVLDALAGRLGRDRVRVELSRTFPQQLPEGSARLAWCDALVAELLAVREWQEADQGPEDDGLDDGGDDA